MTNQRKKRILQRKADKIAQQIFVSLNPYCLICGGKTSCGHHYYPKSTASSLRYDFQNLIPLCAGHHFSHHNGNPEIHNRVNELKGKKWLEELRAKKRNLFVKTSLGYYKNIIINLEKIYEKH